jgi:hypothetical protein
LQALLDAMAPGSRGTLLATFAQFRRQLADELRDKFDFWLHVPYRMVGVFYCVQGGDLEEAKQIARECVAEYEKAIADGLYDKLHRVAHLLLGKGTVCRKELAEFIARGQRLEDFPVLYFTLQEYALCSLVERAVEAMHAKIKRIGSTMTFSLPPYVCAVLREGSHLQSLLANADFHAFCISNWRKRSLADDILQQRCSKEELASMTTLQKSKRIYQSDAVSHFQLTGVARQSQGIWLALTNTSPITVDIPQDWHLCVSYLKATLQRGAFYSVPTSLYALGVENRNHDFTRAGRCDAGLEAVHARTLDFRLDSPDDVRIFQIVNATPESRPTVKLPHLARSRTSIRVAPYAILCSQAGGTRVIVSNDSLVLDTIDLCSWVSCMDLTLRSLFRWSVGAKLPSVKFRSRPAALCDFDTYDLPPIVGSAASPIVGSAASPIVVAQVPEAFDNAGALAVTQVLERTCFSQDGSSVDFASLLDVHVDIVDKLVASGVLQRRFDEFGSATLTLNRSVLQHSFLLALGSAVQHVRLTSPGGFSTASKLEVVVALHLEGWVPVLNLNGGWSIGGAMEYNSGLSQPKSYYYALLHRDEIIAKGVDTILHGMPDKYYRCLLELKQQALVSVVSHPHAGNNAWYEQELKAHRTTRALCDSEVGEVEPTELLPMSAEQPLQIEDGPLLPPDVTESSWSRVMVDAGIGTVKHKIYFDNNTHSSGRQRGWIDCTHHPCIKYDFCDRYATKLLFCTALYFWEVGGQAFEDDKYGHLAWVPLEADVHQSTCDVRMTPF